MLKLIDILIGSDDDQFCPRHRPKSTHPGINQGKRSILNKGNLVSAKYSKNVWLTRFAFDHSKPEGQRLRGDHLTCRPSCTVHHMTTSLKYYSDLFSPFLNNAWKYQGTNLSSNSNLNLPSQADLSSLRHSSCCVDGRIKPITNCSIESAANPIANAAKSLKHAHVSLEKSQKWPSAGCT